MVTMGSPADIWEGIAAVGKLDRRGHWYRFFDSENLPCHIKRSQRSLATVDARWSVRIEAM